MDRFVVEGGRRLEGRVRVNGSKNAALPLLAAALLTDRPVRFRDVPDLADIRNMLGLLAELGCCRTDERGTTPDPSNVTLQSVDESPSHARYDVVKTMRASICVLGPLLARRGHARVSMPGGCAIGDRPVDLHLRGLRALGARITLEGGDIVAAAPPEGLRGETVFLGGPFGSTVLGTANVMSAAALARGRTVIESAACEPEIVDLARLLNAMGARITGAGSPRITIDGVPSLAGADHAVIPDRIEAGTLMCAAAITRGSVVLDNCPLDAMLAAVDRLEAAGVRVEPVGGDDPLRCSCRVSCDRAPRPVEVTTQPHPGFPTDLQAQLMALLCIAEGNSVITERIFPERFLHVAELGRMGASLFRSGATVVVSGVRRLRGAPVMASDLRASASLVIAALAAEGTTTISRIYHLDRGYERLEDRLTALGATIAREKEPV
ncbi:MAG: UDP-N-acetylglucosamine 1-carboxyvinyltransferase [Phycisphaeraceae bacterium]|nr:UDP-N-acetylglucosamine 1-carboxyvinyltransferase [Phycisphaeraceae bacterium]